MQRHDTFKTLERPVHQTPAASWKCWSGESIPAALLITTLINNWVLITRALTAMSTWHQKHRMWQNIYVGQNTKMSFLVQNASGVRLPTINTKLSSSGVLQEISSLKKQEKVHCFPQTKRKKSPKGKLITLSSLLEEETLNKYLHTLLRGAQLCWWLASNGNLCETQPRNSVTGSSSILRQGSCQATVCLLSVRVRICMKTVIKYLVSLGKSGGE